MAIRQHTVWPDSYARTALGDIAVVSDDAFYAGLMRVAQMIPVGGGSIAVAVERQKTGIPNESLTTRAVIEWRSHTNGKPAVEPDDRDAEKIVAAMHGAVESAEPGDLERDEDDDREDERTPFDEADVEDFTAAR